MSHAQLGQLFTELKKAFRNEEEDKCKLLLAQLKIALVQNGLLPPSPNASKTDLGVAREILEVGAFFSIRSRDVPSFDRYYSQLQTFYDDYRQVLPPSPREHPVRGLQLIRLLTQNRIADFHTALEGLPISSEQVAADEYLSHPVRLERWLMEGSYAKVWSAREDAPTDEYEFFVDELMGTIRNEIASCEEAAYDSLPLKDAATLLFFTNQSELLRFAEGRRWHVDLTGGRITFAKTGEDTQEIPKEKLIAQSLIYARELEAIV